MQEGVKQTVEITLNCLVINKQLWQLSGFFFGGIISLQTSHLVYSSRINAKSVSDDQSKRILIKKRIYGLENRKYTKTNKMNKRKATRDI